MQGGGEVEKCSGHGAEDRVVSADRRSVLVVLCFGMANLIELRLERKFRMTLDNDDNVNDQTFG